jgi:hypothetical protein
MAIPKMRVLPLIASDLKAFVADRQFRTVLADPPWRFANRTGKMAPEHRRISVHNHDGCRKSTFSCCQSHLDIISTQTR